MDIERNYADLVVKTGLNLKEGQILVVNSPIECAEFARLVQVRAYEAGAREVVMRWIDDRSSRITYDMAPDEIFDEFPEWAKRFFEGYSDADAAFLTIHASDPEIMKGVEPSRIARQTRARSTALERFRMRQMSNMHRWCVVASPSPAWAKKVFPDLDEAGAMLALGRAIHAAVRADIPDPLRAWNDHRAALASRVAFLNDAQFVSLHYTTPRGTDLVVRLPERHIWFGGGDRSADGREFVANLPTEEVFTMPLRDGVHGIVYATMPLSHNGNLVEDFWFRFEDGLVCDYGAAKGLGTLRELLEIDEGARRLGEVALVPYDSPVARLGILFYNTLYDENASCHFALGKAYPVCIAGGTGMDKGQLLAAGVNDSLVHVDFMVGAPDLSIAGIRGDGTRKPLFVDGVFAGQERNKG